MPQHTRKMKHTVKVIIPFYKEQLSKWETLSLANTMKVFSKRKIVFLKPNGLDITYATAPYPEAETISVTDDWLGTKRGIAGYNEMMMSETFYGMFADTEYILICHTDAWVFRDELSAWCDGTYDIVAAPWPTKPLYKHFPIKQYFRFRKRNLPDYTNITAPLKHIPRLTLYGKVGNGGLSLRKVSTHITACRKYAKEIGFFIASKQNEDMFWALTPKEMVCPDEATALSFAFDTKPRLCYKLNHKQLHMGCHRFTHKSHTRFWQQFIPLST